MAKTIIGERLVNQGFSASEDFPSEKKVKFMIENYKRKIQKKTDIATDLQIDGNLGTYL